MSKEEELMSRIAAMGQNYYYQRELHPLCESTWLTKAWDRVDETTPKHLRCWLCRNPLKERIYSEPIGFERETGKFTVSGIYCTLNCVAHIIDECQTFDKNQKRENFSIMCADVYGLKEMPKPYLHASLYTFGGGTIDESEWFGHNDKQPEMRIVTPPFIIGRMAVEQKVIKQPVPIIVKKPPSQQPVASKLENSPYRPIVKSEDSKMEVDDSDVVETRAPVSSSFGEAVASIKPEILLKQNGIIPINEFSQATGLNVAEIRLNGSNGTEDNIRLPQNALLLYDGTNAPVPTKPVGDTAPVTRKRGRPRKPKAPENPVFPEGLQESQPLSLGKKTVKRTYKKRKAKDPPTPPTSSPKS